MQPFYYELADWFENTKDTQDSNEKLIICHPRQFTHVEWQTKNT